MQFTPSLFSVYGADEAAQAAEAPPPESDYDEYLAYFEEYGPSVMRLIAGKTAREKYEILKVKIANQKKAYKEARLKVVKKLIASNIDKLQAQLRAAEYELAEEQETSEFLRYTKGLTIAGIGVGIGLAVLLAFQISQTLSSVRRAQDRK